MKKRFYLLLPTLFSMILAGCGGNDNTPESSGNPGENGGDSGGGSGNPGSEATSFTVTFKDENGNVLDSREWDKDSIPSYSYSGPNDTDEWDYTFNGWSLTQGGEPLSSLPSVSESATYFALVSATKKQYTITFDSRGGSDVSPITVDYGTQINAPAKPTKTNYKFVGWSLNQDGSGQVTFPYTVTANHTFYGNWNEKINLKPYLEELITSLKKSEVRKYIPETMVPDYVDNHLTSYDVDYDFESFTNVSNIHYGGFGEQWQMTVDTLLSVDKFYSIFASLEPYISASVVIYNNYLDQNTEDSAVLELDEENYQAKIGIAWAATTPIMVYNIKLKNSISVPLFGSIKPEIHFSTSTNRLYDSCEILLNTNNYLVWSSDYYNGVHTTFYDYKIGNDTVYKTSSLTFNRDTSKQNELTGKVYEETKYEDKDLIKKAAYFMVDSEYVSVVGNKASGLPGFAGYINELYDINTGKLLGYKVRETFTKWGFEKTYNTLWFNLPDIKNISSVKAISNGSVDPHENHHDIYLNGSSEKFEPKKNKVALVSTSRRYDVELRKQFFYGLQEGKLVEFETEIPMMFIQDDGTKSGETNYSTFSVDIAETNGINALVTLSSKHLERIRSDYLTLIDYFIENIEK